MRKYLIINTSIFAQIDNKENVELETTYDEIKKISNLLLQFNNKFYIIDLEEDTIIFMNK